MKGMKWYQTWVNARGRELHYRPDLDGLRGIAILAVLGFHAFPTLAPGGFVGVDIFFVISGFLISTLILAQLRRSTFKLSDFYIRRARRLLPALAIVLAVCLYFGWFVLLPDEFENLGKHVAAAAAFAMNFSVWREGGYFEPAANLNPVLHLWSLGIEEQFYLLWPLVLLLLWRRRRRLVLTIAVLVAASFAANIAFAHTDPRGDFYLPVTRFWELGLGCLLAAREDTQPGAGRLFRFEAQLRPVLSVLGFILICGAVFLFDSRMAFPGWAALIPVTGAMCVICATPDNWFQRNIVAGGPLVFVGIISYPLYLWHWPLLSVATILGSGLVPTAVRSAAVALSFILAYLVFRFVELPIRSRPPARASGVLVAGLGALGAAGLAIHAASGISARFGHDIRSLQMASKVNRYCLATFAGQGDFNYCKSTSADAPKVMFLGDSRTQALYDGMVLLAGRRYPMMLLARGGCPPLLNAHAGGSENHRGSCDSTWSHFIGYVRALGPRVVVIVGGGSAEVDDLSFKKGLRQLIGELQGTAKLIYVRETPIFATGPSCFLRPVKVPWGMCYPVVERTTIEQQLAAHNEAVNEIETGFPGLVVVDSIQALCDSKYCSQKQRTGAILYRDPLHLTAAGARQLAEGSGLSAVIDEEMKTPPPGNSRTLDFEDVNFEGE
jgi:peptidoglycan/LPS O-acetylase OafA/YrhL